MEELIAWLRSATGLSDDVNVPEIPEQLVPVLEALRVRVEETEKQRAEE